MLLRRRYMGEKGGSIPYQRIEYLQSSGTQYIDTGISGNNDNLEITIDFYAIGSSENGFLGNVYASYNATTIRARNLYGTYILEKCLNTKCDSSGTTRISFVGEQRYLIVSNKQGITINGEYYSSQDYSTSGSTNNRNIALFRSNYNGGYSSMKCYAFSIKDSGVLVRNFVPVRVGQVGYMYDTVSGELFGNLGTGDFVLGQDIN